MQVCHGEAIDRAQEGRPTANRRKTHSHAYSGGGICALLAALIVAICTTRTARAEPDAQSDPPVCARDSGLAWSHANPWDYSLTGIGAAALVVELGIFQPIRPPLHWSRPILFDTDVRNALRASGDRTRNDLEDVAWVLWGAQLAYPVLVDVPYAWRRYDYEVARDLFWQDAMTLTLAGAVDGVLRDVVGRARPEVSDCLARGGGIHCLDTNTDTTRSFPGGHIVNSTAASVLTCTQHSFMELYGGPWDEIACATTLASDATLAVLRIVSDNHWVTDQIAGMAIGAVLGWGIPYVVHFRAGARGAAESGSTSAAGPSFAAMVAPMPMVLDHGAGLGVMGLY